jgi:hypothetical protein
MRGVETAMPRPPHVKPPAYLSPNKPIPKPAAAEPAKPDEGREDPTRYGDWTRKGVAVDF